MIDYKKLWDILPEELAFLKEKENAYIVGGAVRDFYLRRDIEDIDIIVDQETFDYIKNNIPSVQINKRFATLRTLTKIPVDVNVIKSDLKTDLYNRDFTINAAAVSPKGHIVSHVHWEYDLKHRIINMVSDINILGDPLRMLRAFRLALSLNFTIETTTLLFIIEMIRLGDLRGTARERIKDELDKIMAIKGAGSLFMELRGLGILCEIVPPLKKTEFFRGGKGHGRDLLDHNIYTMMCVDMFDDLSKEEQRILRWATLLHDIAKVDTVIRKDDGTLGFYGHDKLGGEIAYEFLKSLRYSNTFCKRVKRIIEMHMRPHFLGDNPTDKALRRFLRDAEGDHKLVVYHAICDSWADKADPNAISRLYSYIDRLEELSKEKKIKRPVNGNDIMEVFGVKEGPDIGKILKFEDELLLENPQISRDEVLKKIKEEFNL